MLRLLSALLIVLPALAWSSDTDQQPTEPVICPGKFALCTSAPCMPDPNDASRTICDCEVTTGLNFAFDSCKARIPTTAEDGSTRVVSTYGLVQAPMKPVMTCPAGTNWSDCLGVPCTVDPRNPERAICSCKLVTPEDNAEDYVTYGGACNQLSCDTAFWSAATVESFAEGTQDLLLTMKLKTSPVTFCPAAQ